MENKRGMIVKEEGWKVMGKRNNKKRRKREREREKIKEKKRKKGGKRRVVG